MINFLANIHTGISINPKFMAQTKILTQSSTSPIKLDRLPFTDLDIGRDSRRIVQMFQAKRFDRKSNASSMEDEEREIDEGSKCNFRIN